MDFSNYSLSEFLGIILIAPILNYLVIALFDGMGIFKDNFLRK